MTTLTQIAFALGAPFRALYKKKLWRVHSVTSVGYGATLDEAVLDCISRLSWRGEA